MGRLRCFGGPEASSRLSDRGTLRDVRAEGGGWSVSCTRGVSMGEDAAG